MFSESILSFVLLEESSVILSAGKNNSSLSETLDHRKPRGAESSITSMTKEEQSPAKFRPWQDFKTPLFFSNSPSPRENWRPRRAHLSLKCHVSLISSYFTRKNGCHLTVAPLWWGSLQTAGHSQSVLSCQLSWRGQTHITHCDARHQGNVFPHFSLYSTFLEKKKKEKKFKSISWL